MTLGAGASETVPGVFGQIGEKKAQHSHLFSQDCCRTLVPVPFCAGTVRKLTLNEPQV